LPKYPRFDRNGKAIRTFEKKYGYELVAERTGIPLHRFNKDIILKVGGDIYIESYLSQAEAAWVRNVMEFFNEKNKASIDKFSLTSSYKIETVIQENHFKKLKDVFANGGLVAVKKYCDKVYAYKKQLEDAKKIQSPEFPDGGKEEVVDEGAGEHPIEHISTEG